MREIKFRAWDNNTKKMVYSGKKYTDGGLLDWFEDEDLMQRTGLKDKNGVRIYESDLVKDNEGNVLKVEWTDLEVGFRLYGNAFIYKESPQMDGFPNYENLNWVDLEVIGNIYENPELREEI